MSRFEGGRAFSTPFVVIVRLNVTLARALAALDASMLSDDARRYLDYMRFLATRQKRARTAGHRCQRVRSRPTPKAKS